MQNEDKTTYKLSLSKLWDNKDGKCKGFYSKNVID